MIHYVSPEAQTRLYILVEPFPTTGAKWQIPTGQSFEPVWTPEGDGIIFASVDGDMKRADVRASEGNFEVLGISDLFSTDLAQLPGDRVEIAPDGRASITYPRDPKYRPSSPAA